MKFKRSESRIFDTSTEHGIQSAERYKERLNNKYDHVAVYAIGLYRVQIIGQKPTEQGSALTPVIAILTAFTVALVLIAQSGLLHTICARLAEVR